MSSTVVIFRVMARRLHFARAILRRTKRTSKISSFYTNIALQTSLIRNISTKVKQIPSNECKSKDSEEKMPDYYVFVKTLFEYYDDVPKGGVYDTCYADSDPDADYDPSFPVVLGLHDTPGSHSDLMPLLNTLSKVGCRTVAPTFPGHGKTFGLIRGYDDLFCQSVGERSLFIYDFINDIGLDRIDMLVACGVSCYTAIMLANLHPDLIKSLVLICPWSFNHPRYNISKNCAQTVWLYDRPIFRPFSFLSTVAIKKPIGCKTLRDKITLAFLMNELDFVEIDDSVTAFRTLNIPRTVIYGDADNILDANEQNIILDRLGISHSNVFRYIKTFHKLNPFSALVFPDCDNKTVVDKQQKVIAAHLASQLQKKFVRLKVFDSHLNIHSNPHL